MRSNRRIISTLCCLLLSILKTSAQMMIDGRPAAFDTITNTMLATIPQNYFNQNLLLTVQLTNDWTHLTIDSQPVVGDYLFNNVSAGQVYRFTARQSDGQEISGCITFTYLPLIQLSGTFNTEYSDGTFMLCDPESNETPSLSARIKWRGGTTNGPQRHKHNYKVKFADDYSFLGLRSDNNWILDAGQADLFRLRNRIATETWNDFATKPYYADQKPKAMSGVRGRVVEVFLNHEYQGIYALTECLDRKQMKLCKADTVNKEIHGLLWKAVEYGYSTMYNNPIQPYDNTSEVWNAFETKYPDLEDTDTLDWSLLKEAIQLVAKGTNSSFKSLVDDYFDLPVMTDLQLFIEVMGALDNRGKNTYFAIYDKAQSRKITFAVWDLDLTMGNRILEYYSPGYSASDYEIGFVNKLTQRLSNINYDDFNTELNNRYAELRTGAFAVDSLYRRYQHYYHLLHDSGADRREENRWSGDSDVYGSTIDFADELEYIRNWIIQRMAYLDNKYMYDDAIRTPVFTPNHHVYNIQGQRMENAQPKRPGIYIRDGHKYVVGAYRIRP